jgi:hypothetical protein
MGILDRIAKAYKALRKPIPSVTYSKAPKPHHEYFIERRSDGFFWRARFYRPQVDALLNLTGTEVREETGAEPTEAKARKSAFDWCRRQGTT